ncbi:MAG TPA: sulfatase-like hydrolase/transferase [Vicinamibacterales bacterium]|nr:sulfatase-like hydrolase/transferase [Vicinamibacterales bacterium]
MTRESSLALSAAACLLLTACSGRPPSAPVSKPNVLLVTIDTLRADRLGRGLTPALDALASRGVRYATARATAPLTLPSHASILTGTLPPEHGVRVNGVALAVRPTLARAFADAGYRTGAFVGAYVLDRRFGLSGGFSIYDDRIPRDPSGAARLEAERRGDVVVTSALAWLGQASAQPFFAWVHLYDPHAPYEPPQEHLARARGSAAAAYDGEVAFADAQVGRLLEWLRTTGNDATTIVAVTGDHGEGLGDHGEATHGMLAYDSTLRVPLVMAFPANLDLPAGVGARRQSTIEQPVSLADLAGTLLQAAGVSVPAGMRPGPLGKDGEAYAESKYPESAGWHDLSALAFERWKVIASSTVELYDLQTDPDERRNLAGEKLSVVDGARRRLAALRAAAGSSAAVPADAADRLRALGYVSGSPSPITGDAPNPASVIAAWNSFERELTRLTSGDARGALPGLAQLARAHPGSGVFQGTYARALTETGRAAQAVDIYRRLVARQPNDAAMYHDLAVAAAAAGMTGEALRAEQASLALQPSNAAASNGLGLLLIEAGKPAEAVAAFERATQDDPSNAVFWANLGNARRDSGDAARAEQAYRAALDRDPRSPDAANGLGVLLVQQQRPADAIRWFEQALAGSPKFVEARLNLGIAYQETGRRDAASAAYRRVLADAPEGSRERGAAEKLLASLK